MQDTNNSRSWWRLLAALALVVTTATLWMAPREAAAEGPKDLIQKKTLKNGLDVIVIPDPSLPIVTIEIAVKNGAFTEPPEYNGLSHLYEHMFFKGNAVIPNQEVYLERMRELGIVFNGTTSTERVNYFFTLPSSNVEPGLEFMYNAITSPKFDEEEFRKEKQVVIGEIERNESSPYYWFREAMEDELWTAHPSRKDSLGDRETVQNATVEQMRTMKERYYVPNNSALLIAGDVEPADAFTMAANQFADWKSGPNPFVKYPVPEHPALEETSTFIVEKPIKVPYAQFSWHGPSVDEDPQATYAADVLSFILGQPTSKFQKNLVESGLTLSADLSYYTQRYTGPISLRAQINEDRMEEAITALLQEVYKLQDPDYFTDEQLQNAKTILAVQDVYDREKTSNFAHTVSFWWATAGSDYYLNYVENLNATTRQDIADYVKNYIIGKPFVMGLLVAPQVKETMGLTNVDLAAMVEKAQMSIEAGETEKKEESDEN